MIAVTRQVRKSQLVTRLLLLLLHEHYALRVLPLLLPLLLPLMSCTPLPLQLQEGKEEGGGAAPWLLWWR